MWLPQVAVQTRLLDRTSALRTSHMPVAFGARRRCRSRFWQDRRVAFGPPGHHVYRPPRSPVGLEGREVYERLFDRRGRLYPRPVVSAPGGSARRVDLRAPHAVTVPAVLVTTLAGAEPEAPAAAGPSEHAAAARRSRDSAVRRMNLLDVTLKPGRVYGYGTVRTGGKHFLTSRASGIVTIDRAQRRSPGWLNKSTLSAGVNTIAAALAPAAEL